MIDIGNAILVAAFPSIPTPCPMKIWSTILYSELTSILMIAGIANLTISFSVFSVARGFLSFFTSFILPLLYKTPECKRSGTEGITKV